MKKFTKFSLPLLLLMFLMQACTKDIVPNPTSVNVPQTTIYDQNFDSASVVIPNLPTGWVAVDSPSADKGWVTDNTNSSYTLNGDSGYVGASGTNEIKISNSTYGGTFTITSASISTLGFNNISVTYGARNSSKFSSNGSAISLAFSTNGGATWENIPYTENPADSYWHLINNGGRMSLPATAANQAGIIFRWTATLVVTTSGTYRIDDFQVFGTSL